MQKFKIQIILRSSPEKCNAIKQRPAQYSKKDLYMQGVLYGRSASTSLPSHLNNNSTTNNNSGDNQIDLRDRIVKPKQCLLRPTSQKEKQSRLFTEKCLEIISKKRYIGNSGNSSVQEHHLKMQAMMNNVVDKYKKVISQSKSDFMGKSMGEKTITQPKTQAGYSQLTGFEDKIQVYRMIKSTQLKDSNRQSQKFVAKDNQWRNRPDVTGVRVNTRILKSQAHDIQGVQCFSIPISELPLTRRQSLVVEKSGFVSQPRATSSSSCRRKVSISRNTSQKFMAFSLNSDSDGLYMKKLKSFLDFIFKINYSNKIYINLQLSEDTINIKKYKVFIGKGNNSLLIKSLLRRRFWLQIVENSEEQGINFYWSQNKINKLHYKQPISKHTKLSRQTKQQTKRKQPKDPQQKQILELNKKIVPAQECYAVQQHICRDGYYISSNQQERSFYSLVTNHLPRNSSIGSKKNLFKSLYFYYKNYTKTNPFLYIPLTYNVKGPEDPQFKKFLKQHESEGKRVWIIKPGQNSNRGNGIKLAQTLKIVDLIKRKQKHNNGQTKTYIIQSYIDKPFLYNSRKFDIRHYMMMTSVNGIIKCYWYKEGYIRTSSEKYDIEDLDNEQIHLTNDAIQKKYEEYEKYEPGNKVSYAEFQRYLDLTYPSKIYNFEKEIVSKMKNIILDVIKANYNTIDKTRRQSNFEIFGFDFMVDRDFKPWLIQINFNPCLEINCPVLSRIIPTMVQNSLRIGLDPLLPPSNHYPGGRRFSLTDNFLRNLKYELLFDELTFDQTIPELYQMEDSDDEEEEYLDEGKEIDQLII